MDRSDRRVLSRLLLLLLAVYLLTMAGRLTSGDGETVYQTTRALVLSRQLAVPPRPETAIGRGGGYYGKYGLGTSLAQAPFLVAGEAAGVLFNAGDDRPARFAVGMTNSAVSVALAGVFWLLCRRLGASRLSATAATLVLGFASLVWPYARADFSEPLQTLCLLTTFYAFLRWRHANGRAAYIVWPALAGAAAGLAFLTKAASVVVLAPLALYFAALLWERRSLGPRRLLPVALAAALPFAACTVFQLTLNVYRFGSLSEFGYGDEPKVGFTTPLHLGVQYLLASTGKGLFFFAPPVVAGLMLLPALGRRYPREAVAAGLVFAAELLYFGRWWAWHGDWAWGARYMYVTVPFALMGLVPLFSQWRSWRLLVRAAASATIVAGVAVSMLGVLIDYGAYFSVVGSQLGRGVDVNEARLVPRFSPILGHAWLARATLYDTLAAWRTGGAPRDPADNPALRRYPWADSHPTLVPEAPERALGFDLWFTALPRRTRFVEFWSILAAAWLALSLLPLALSLRRSVRRATGCASRHVPANRCAPQPQPV